MSLILRALLIPLVSIALLVGAGEKLSAQSVKYEWEQQYYGLLNGEKSLMFSREMRSNKLAFADIDGDGDQDVFVGQENGEIAYFENKGTSHQPDYVLDTQQYKAVFEHQKGLKKINVWNKIDVGEFSAPSLVDIDNDGDFDLFVGTGEGRIWYFENQGNNLIPVFKLITPRFQGINVGRNSVILFEDVNLQRKYDMLVGTLDGKVWLFMNNGTRNKPDFTRDAPRKVVNFSLETHAAPGLMDWDQDGDLDLIVGQKNGTLDYYENVGDQFKPDWKLKEKNFQLIDIGGESSPVFIDMDGDDDKDLVLGSANPTVSHYENRIQSDNRIFWNRSNNLFAFSKLVVTGNRASMAVGDLDGDDDLDLIVGERLGNLNYFENRGDAKNPDWALKTEEMIFMTGLENSAPALGDLDDDGDLDLLVGEKQGQIAYVENIGTAKAPKWDLKSKTYFQIDVGSNSVPRLWDVDGDGDLDLFIGNFTGRVVLFLNQGTKKVPQFALDSTRYASAKVQSNAVPAFFDWNKDKFSDLIVGGVDGKVQLLYSPGKVGKDALNWEVDDKSLANFQVDQLSHPLFVDFNGDGNKDFLIGNDEGDFLLFVNKGTEGTSVDQLVAVDNSIDQTEGSLVVEEVEGPIEIEIEDEYQAGDSEETFEEELYTEGLAVLDEGPEKIKVDPKYVKQNTPLIRNPEIKQSAPTFGDLDQDGDLDILIGSKSGAVYYYDNEGTDSQWNYVLKSSNFLRNDGFENTVPKLVDFDQDGDLDIILGTKRGQVLYYANHGTIEQPRFVREKETLKNLWLGAFAKPTVFDINNDGILDLLVGNLLGKLVFIRNDSNRFSIIRRDYDLIDIGIASAPLFADLNNGGTFELIVGSDSGKIHILRNESGSASGSWEPLTDYGGALTPPRGTVPAVVDLDNDGDMDLILGTDLGDVILYRNDGIVKEATETQQLLDVE